MTFVPSGSEDGWTHPPSSSYMMARATVLIVTAEAPVRESVGGALAAHGFEVLAAETFTAGRDLLVERRPEVLVTSVRLHEHNGIHLAIVSRRASALTKTIVIGYGDRVLESEARQAGAVYLVDPDIGEVLSAVDGAIHRRERKWPRGRANISARAADQAVRLVDLSYGGFRIELAPGTALPTGNGFDLTVGTLRISALRVWMKQQTGDDRVWCGAAVTHNGESNLAWREFVDDAIGRHHLRQ